MANLCACLPPKNNDLLLPVLRTPSLWGFFFYLSCCRTNDHRLNLFNNELGFRLIGYSLVVPDCQLTTAHFPRVDDHSRKTLNFFEPESHYRNHLRWNSRILNWCKFSCTIFVSLFLPRLLSVVTNNGKSDIRYVQILHSTCTVGTGTFLGTRTSSDWRFASRTNFLI